MVNNFTELIDDFWAARVEDRVLITRLHDNATDADFDQPVRPAAARLSASGRADARTTDDGRPTWLKSERSQQASEKVEVKWRKKLGEFLVQDLIVPIWESRPGRKWSREGISQGRLQLFPRGYSLYTVKRVGDVGRSDHYLWCDRQRAEYRSPEEFAPHLLWILRGRNTDAQGRPRCECLYCKPGGSTQREISARYRNVGQYFSMPTSSGSGKAKQENTARRRRDSHASSVGSSSGSHLSRPSSSSSLNQGFQAKDYRRFDTQPPQRAE